MVLIENVLAVLFFFCGTHLFVEMLICVGDWVYCH